LFCSCLKFNARKEIIMEAAIPTIWPKGVSLGVSLPEVLRRAAQTYGAHTALIADEARWSFTQLKEAVDRAAKGFIALGVRPGDHIAVWAVNVPEYVFAFWAAASVGATVVTVNSSYKTGEAEYVLRQADIHTLVIMESYKDSAFAEMVRSICPELAETDPGASLRVEKLPELRNVVTIGFDMPGCTRWDAMLALGEGVADEALQDRAQRVKPDDVFLIQYTSGTTGFPKGVMLTHNIILGIAKVGCDEMSLTPADRAMVILPVFHVFGLIGALLCYMVSGVTMIFPSPSFSPAKALECINDHRVTTFLAVPMMFYAMLMIPQSMRTDFSSLRIIITGGTNIPPVLAQMVKDRMNNPELTTAYGQTECGGMATYLPSSATLEQLLSTVGWPMAGVECDIVDLFTGESQPDDTDGEIIVRGYNVMPGYYKMPEATAAVLDKDGWLHTGDMGRRRADGAYVLTGRAKDMINRGGENIYPKEVEDLLGEHPDLSGVQVVAVPDPVLGEEVFAWVVADDDDLTEEELRAWALENMSRQKVPKYFRFCEAFPMNASGKVLKYKLRDMAAEALAS